MGNFSPQGPINVDISVEPSKAHSFSMKKPLSLKSAQQMKEQIIQVMLNKIHLGKDPPLFNLPNGLVCFLLLST